MLQFDEALFDFGDEKSPNGSYLTKEAFYTGHAELKKSDEFIVEGNAKLPIKAGLQLDLNLSGDGNFLAVLPDVADLFEGTDSQGHLDLKMAGYYTKPDFRGSRFDFTKGKLGITLFVFSLIIIVFMFLGATNTISNVSAVETEGVGVYWDSGCTDRVSQIDWEVLTPGSQKNIVVNIRNEVEDQMSLLMSTKNWNPSEASRYLLLGGTTMEAGWIRVKLSK